MNRDAIGTRILEEMEHIDWGERHSPQSLLRMLYGAHRKKQLEKNPDADAGVSLKRALARTQREYPYFIAVFDTAYFRLSAGTLASGLESRESFRAAREPGFRPRRVGVTS
jgi:hypothetical protein